MRCVPWMVTPQLVLLIWRAQLRGLMSYFSLPDLKRIGSALGLAFFTQLAIRFVSHGRFAPTVSILLLHLILSLVLLGGMRLALRLVRERASRSKSKSAVTWWRVAVVGTGDIATRLAVELGNDGNGARQVVAFFDDNPRMWNKLPHGVPVVGMPECLLNSEWHSKIDEVIIALPEDEAERSREIGEMLKGTSVTVSYATAWPVLKPLEV
ncbi:MAG TPA: hypothetical protein VEC99_01035 [Clostridia bacterium]|nr:hypothetical protein [Clostridia bacterium]